MTSSVVCSDDGWNMYTCKNGAYTYSRCEGKEANDKYSNAWAYYDYYGQSTMQGFCNNHTCETAPIAGVACDQYTSPVIMNVDSSNTDKLAIYVCSFDNEYNKVHTWARNYNGSARELVLSKDKKGFMFVDSSYYNQHDCTLGSFMRKTGSTKVTDSNGETHPVEVCFKCVDFEDDERGYAYYTCPEP